jgi:DNA polymerase-3 subunit delta'
VRYGTVPGFDAIIGQSLPIGILQTLIRKSIVPHALLFTGRQGSGKTTTARYFAAALNCLKNSSSEQNTVDRDLTGIPCGDCRNCCQIMADSHPDMITIKPDKALVRINQIRELRVKMSMKAFSASQRVVIISDGQYMNSEASNALLKLLEEPPKGTVLIITAIERSDLLPTIVSRCRHIRFNPIPTDDIETYLTVYQGMEASQAAQAARIAQGSLGQALVQKANGYLEERNWLIRASGMDKPTKAHQRSIAAALSFAAQLTGHKDRILELLEILKTWIRDLSIFPFAPDQIVNQDLETIIETITPGIDLGQTLHWWQIVEKAQKDIAGNANLRLTLELMALELHTGAVNTR